MICQVLRHYYIKPSDIGNNEVTRIFVKITYVQTDGRPSKLKPYIHYMNFLFVLTYQPFPEVGTSLSALF